MNNISHYPLRLPQSLKQALKQTPEEDGGSMNQFIVMAIAEKLSALKTASFFEKARQNANVDVFWKILNCAEGEPPRAGDES